MFEEFECWRKEFLKFGVVLGFDDVGEIDCGLIGVFLWDLVEKVENVI